MQNKHKQTQAATHALRAARGQRFAPRLHSRWQGGRMQPPRNRGRGVLRSSPPPPAPKTAAALKHQDRYWPPCVVTNRAQANHQRKCWPLVTAPGPHAVKLAMADLSLVRRRSNVEPRNGCRASAFVASMVTWSISSQNKTRRLVAPRPG